MINLFLNKYFLGGILALAIIAGIWYYGKREYNSGYEARDLKAQIEMQKLRADMAEAADKELKRQMDANTQAQNLQKQKIQELESQAQDLEQKLKDNENEANNDQNRDRVGLDPSSVLRLNKIR